MQDTSVDFALDGSKALEKLAHLSSSAAYVACKGGPEKHTPY